MAYRDEPDIDLSGRDPDFRKELRPYFWPLLFFFLSPLLLRALDVSGGLSWAELGFGALWVFAVYLKVRMSRAKEEIAD